MESCPCRRHCHHGGRPPPSRGWTHPPGWIPPPDWTPQAGLDPSPPRPGWILTRPDHVMGITRSAFTLIQRIFAELIINLFATFVELGRGGCVHEFRWNGGGDYKGKAWADHLPTDASVRTKHHVFSVKKQTRSSELSRNILVTDVCENLTATIETILCIVPFFATSFA